MNAAATRDPLRPPRSADLRASVGAALGVHLLLVLMLSLGVRWHSSEPPAVDAELWSATPQFAAPAPPPPTPTPPPAPRPVVRAAPTGPTAAEIALARQRAAQQHKDQQLKLQAEQRQRQLDAIKKQAEAKQRVQQQSAAQRKAEQAQQMKLQQQQAREQQQARAQYLKNMLTQAGSGQGQAGSSGSAAVTSGPSGGYGARLSTLIRSNVIFPDQSRISGDPKVTLLVTLDPNNGEVLAARVTASSGVPSWDQAVQRAVLRIGRLPSDHGRWYSPMEVTAGPRDPH